MSELAHFGIKGMHWGVRRFQNPDGTLTELGKKRYGPLSTEYVSKMKIRQNLNKLDSEIANSRARIYEYTQKQKKVEKDLGRMDERFMDTSRDKKKLEKIKEKIAQYENLRDRGRNVTELILKKAEQQDLDITKLKAMREVNIGRNNVATVLAALPLAAIGVQPWIYPTVDQYVQGTHYSVRDKKKIVQDGLEDDNFLEHHGIKGMRWGVRRYQNPDGTLTTAGKLRYRMADGSPRELTTSAKLKKHLQDLQRRHLEKAKARKEERAEKKEERKVEKAAEDRARRIEEAKNDPEKMTRLSDDELREVINRINLETQYMNARDKAMEGRRFVDKLISGTGKAVSLTTNVANIAGNLANLKEKWNKFTGNDDPNRDLKERSEKLRLLNEINDYAHKLDPKNRKAREEAEALAADVKKAEGEAKIAEFKNKKEALEKKLPQGNDTRKQQNKIENGAKTVERVLAEAGKKKDTKQDNNQKPSEPHVNKADEYIRNSQPGRLTGKESTPAKSEPRVNKADEYVRNSQPGRLTGKESTPVKSEPRTNKADYYIKNVSDNKAKAADADRRLNQAIADDIEQRRRRIEEERKRKKK